MARYVRALAFAGALAGTTILVSPAAAAPLAIDTGVSSVGTIAMHSRYDPAGANAAWGCRWGGWGCGGWGGGWGGGWRRRGIGAGDVLLGAAIIGGIAAVISSNNRRERDRDVVIVDRDRDWRERDWQRDPDWQRDREWQRRDDGRDGRGMVRGDGASGLDSAVDACLNRIERDVRVDTVDNVDRTGAGWVVSGTLFNGSSFQCRIGNGGQIDGIDYGGGLSAASPASETRGEQWSDERYANARQAIRTASGPTLASANAGLIAEGQQAPAYPGGPVPGEVIPETADEAS